ncbi:MAG: hypothetical protein JXX14_22065 [Deltaproteobacteria bacterium]|nr:hypothetical protein [Deltaproteobacteria bacterium]
MTAGGGQKSCSLAEGVTSGLYSSKDIEERKSPGRQTGALFELNQDTRGAEFPDEISGANS